MCEKYKTDVNPHARSSGCHESIRHPGHSGEGGSNSALSQWPVQLHLVPTRAPYLKNSDILFAADCVPFAYSNFHRDFLEGKKLIIGCPKLDDTTSYVSKLKDILAENEINSLTLVHMEVPCCYGVERIADVAIKELDKSGTGIPVKKVVISIQGKIKEVSDNQP